MNNRKKLQINLKDNNISVALDFMTELSKAGYERMRQIFKSRFSILKYYLP